MRKTWILSFILLISLFLAGCEEKTVTVEKEDIYQKLVMAETLSGMSEKTSTVIRTEGNLSLPTAYEGVTITYTSRNPEIISNNGEVTLPLTCWIESRDQQGTDNDEYANLNDNWPVVIDVVLSYQNQNRSAKLLFVVAPQAGFTCDKYKG
ncbi:MAG: hypothetical protein CVV63_03965 [Tenericutes bacterium HGW-Tenericutes-8]|nr:MAG: hypothetical protein CVV63_03965 [Tenericutes bacterium HGW-Tenericutes-8]